MKNMLLKYAAVAMDGENLVSIRNGVSPVSNVTAIFNPGSKNYTIVFNYTNNHSVVIRSAREQVREFATLEAVRRALSREGIKGFYVSGGE